MANGIQVWDPDEWEVFALTLLQCRHGALKVHKIPAAHKGDFGIDYYCTDELVAYQCYAVQEPIDISTRADRQKKKITTDTTKFANKKTEIESLFLKKPVKHWVLLSPLHDSKEVNIHCANKTIEFRKKKLAHLASDFEISVHDQKNFSQSARDLGMVSMSSISINVPQPTQTELDKIKASSPDLILNAENKLKKRASPVDLQELVVDTIRSFLKANALLDALRLSSPEIYETITAAIARRARRLSLAGPQGGPDPSSILHTELELLDSAIRSALPTLSEQNTDDLVLGTVSEWLMRCPLDFPKNVV